MTEMPGLESLALRVAELRGAVDVGNERTAGQLALLVERSQEAKLALEATRVWVEKELARHEREQADERAAREKADAELASRQWVDKELARHEREQDEERTARVTGDAELASEIKLLTRKSATWTGVALTLSAVGGTILGHVWPH
jgi:hypothetical protein